MSAPDYIPTDDPIKDQNGNLAQPTNEVFDQYINQVLCYGPPPPNYRISLRDHSNTSLWANPCSPAGSQTMPRIDEEFADDRENWIALDHPPAPSYKAGSFVFQRHDDWQSAIAASLTQSGCKYNQGEITKTVVERMHVQYEKQIAAGLTPALALQHVLYYPANRQTAVFRDEPACRRVAKNYSRDLVVLCPFTLASGVGWNSFWDASNRPPMRWRYSTGESARDKFTLIACLPKHGKYDTQEVYWFTVKPSAAFGTTWDEYMERDRDIGLLKQPFNFTTAASTELFIWTLVAAHRTYINGALPKNADLGQWIHQYGERLNRDRGRTQRFVFDPTAPYNGKQVDSQELGAWILNSDKALKYVRLWEDSCEAQLRYLMDRTDDNWEVFRVKMMAARALP